MNPEISLVASLLIDPKLINNLDINPDWIETESLREILVAIQQTEGQTEYLSDLQKIIKQNNALSRVDIDELIMLKNSEPTAENAPFLTKTVHKNYVEKMLARYTKQYSLSQEPKFLESIRIFTDELNALQVQKSDGKISAGYQEFIERLKGTEDPFIKTFPKLDLTLGGGLQGGELVIVGARPAVGKTAFSINLALKILINNDDVAVDFFTLEMTLQQMMNRFISNRSKINSQLIRNPKKLNTQQKNSAVKAYKDLEQMDIRVYDQEYTQLNDIVFAIRKRAKAGKYVAIVDYAGLIQVADSRKNERQVMNEVTRTLKLLTNELGITIVLLAQLNRETDKSNKVPALSDLKESGSLEQDANIVMMLYLPDVDDRKQVKMKIAKNRDGAIGELPFVFRPQFMDFDTEVGP